MSDKLVTLLIVGGLGGLVGALVGRTKRREKEGAALGFFFGPIGWLIVLLLPAIPPPVLPANAKLAVHGRGYGRSSAKDDAWRKAQSEE